MKKMHKIHIKTGPFRYRERSVKALRCLISLIKCEVTKNKLKGKKKKKDKILNALLGTTAFHSMGCRG